MVAIVDYGVGNLFSLQCSFQKIGHSAVVTSSPEEIRASDRVILPGVGAFADAAAKLFDSKMADLLLEEAALGKPVMGICLGMQLLFERSLEFGEHKGLGLIKGTIRPIRDVAPIDYKVPQIGWNALHLINGADGKPHPLFRYINEEDYVYFVHSYYGAECEDSTIAVCEYGAPLTAAVARENVTGCQFHPEKSGDVGLAILKAFCE